MNAPLNTTITTDVGLSVGRVAVTSLQVCPEPNGDITIVMSKDDMALRITASPGQVQHLTALLLGRVCSGVVA